MVRADRCRGLVRHRGARLSPQASPRPASPSSTQQSVEGPSPLQVAGLRRLSTGRPPRSAGWPACQPSADAGAGEGPRPRRGEPRVGGVHRRLHLRRPVGEHEAGRAAGCREPGRRLGLRTSLGRGEPAADPHPEARQPRAAEGGGVLAPRHRRAGQAGGALEEQAGVERSVRSRSEACPKRCIERSLPVRRVPGPATARHRRQRRDRGEQVGLVGGVRRRRGPRTRSPTGSEPGAAAASSAWSMP